MIQENVKLKKPVKKDFEEKLTTICLVLYISFPLCLSAKCNQFQKHKRENFPPIESVWF